MQTEFVLVIITSALTLVSSIVSLYLSRRWRIKDTDLITKKVESIKSVFLKAQSEYQAKLDLIYNSKREIQADQKNIVLDFWEEHFTLLRLCSSLRYEIDELRIKEFHNLIKRIEDQEEKCEATFTKLCFFFEEPEILLSADYINKTISLNSIKFLGYLDNMEPLLLDSQKYYFDNNVTLYKKTGDEINDLSKSIEEYLSENDIRIELNKFKKQCWDKIYNNE
jgi:hypothetical protein